MLEEAGVGPESAMGQSQGFRVPLAGGLISQEQEETSGECQAEKWPGQNCVFR